MGGLIQPSDPVTIRKTNLSRELTRTVMLQYGSFGQATLD